MDNEKWTTIFVEEMSDNHLMNSIKMMDRTRKGQYDLYDSLVQEATRREIIKKPQPDYQIY